MTAFSKNIKFLRKKKGLTQVEIGKQTGIKRTTWANYEIDISQPDFTALAMIAAYFEVTVDDLLNFDMEKGIKLNPLSNAQPIDNPLSAILTSLTEIKEQLVEVNKLLQQP